MCLKSVIVADRQPRGSSEAYSSFQRKCSWNFIAGATKARYLSAHHVLQGSSFRRSLPSCSDIYEDELDEEGESIWESSSISCEVICCDSFDNCRRIGCSLFRFGVTSQALLHVLDSYNSLVFLCLPTVYSMYVGHDSIVKISIERSCFRMMGGPGSHNYGYLLVESLRQPVPWVCAWAMSTSGRTC